MNIIDTLRHVKAEGTHELAGNLTLSTLVPLAAVLLEYPVAYVPSDDPTTAFLSNELLDVYECVIPLAGGGRMPRGPTREQTIIKFSCPQIMGREYSGLSPKQISKQIGDVFGPRLIEATKGEERSPSMEVRHTTVTLDRVAL